MSADEVPGKFNRDGTILNTHLAASSLCEILRIKYRASFSASSFRNLYFWEIFDFRQDTRYPKIDYL